MVDWLILELILIDWFFYSFLLLYSIIIFFNLSYRVSKQHIPVVFDENSHQHPLWIFALLALYIAFVLLVSSFLEKKCLFFAFYSPNPPSIKWISTWSMPFVEKNIPWTSTWSSFFTKKIHPIDWTSTWSMSFDAKNTPWTSTWPRTFNRRALTQQGSFSFLGKFSFKSIENETYMHFLRISTNNDKVTELYPK